MSELEVQLRRELGGVGLDLGHLLKRRRTVILWKGLLFHMKSKLHLDFTNVPHAVH